MKKANVNRLGVFLAGWSELIDGRSDSADSVRTYITDQLRAREMPQVSTEAADGYAGRTEASRPYLLNSRYPGVTGTVFVTAHGEDLYVSWKTFQKPIFNWRRIGFMVLLSLVISLLISLFDYADAWIQLIFRGILLIVWLAFFLVALVGIPYGAWWLSQKIKAMPAFQQQIELTPTVDRIITIGSVVVGLLVVLVLVNLIPPPRLYLYPLNSLLRGAFWILIGLIFGSFLLGFLRHGHALAYILAIPTMFDADDALALSFSLHKTVLHALDQAGIDVTTLHRQSPTVRGRLAEEI